MKSSLTHIPSGTVMLHSPLFAGLSGKGTAIGGALGILETGAGAVVYVGQSARTWSASCRSSEQASWHRRLQLARDQPTYTEAKAALRKLHRGPQLAGVVARPDTPQ